MSDPTERERRYAEAIWSASRADEGTISATGANIVARAIVALVDAEVEMVRRGARTLGKQLDDTLFHVLRASGRSDLIGEDGDGDWALVWEALDALRPRAEAAERALADHALANGGCVPKPAYDELARVLAQIESLAKVQAASCQAMHRADHARNWLDVLAIIERA